MAGRRRLLVGLAAAGLCAAAAPARAARRHKVSKAIAEYQDHPMDVRSCATCTLFVAPSACKKVTGKVSDRGWCLLYDMAD